MNVLRSPLLLILIGLFTPVVQGEAEELFRSNSLGMALESISEVRRDEFTWVLEREERDGTLTERLFRDGEELRKTVSYRKEGLRISEVWSGKQLLRRIEKREGRPLAELEYDAEGLTERREFQWRNGTLQTQRIYRNGALEEVRRYITNSQGRLLQLLRLDPAGLPIAVSGYQPGSRSAFPESEWHGKGERRRYFRYDDEGRIAFRSTAEAGESRSMTRFYREEGALYSRTRLPGERGEIIRRFDEQRRVVEKLIRTHTTVQRERFFYSDGRLARRILRKGGERREWEYRYGENEELSERRYLVNGTVQTSTEYGDGVERLVTVYREGEPAVTMRYRGEELVEKQNIRPSGASEGNIPEGLREKERKD